MNKFENKVLCFMSALGNAYKEDEEREDLPKLELKNEELTEDFTAMLVALSLLYQKITGDGTDLMGFTHILNRLAFQSIMEKDESEEQNAD